MTGSEEGLAVCQVAELGPHTGGDAEATSAALPMETIYIRRARVRCLTLSRAYWIDQVDLHLFEMLSTTAD
jgi:hypothetical protein